MYEFAEMFMTDMDVFLGTIFGSVITVVGIALMVTMIISYWRSR